MKLSLFNYLIRHLQRKHPDQFKKYQDEGSVLPVVPGQVTMTAMFASPSSSSTYGPKHPSLVQFVQSLVENLIVACGVPFSVVENQNLRLLLITSIRQSPSLRANI